MLKSYTRAKLKTIIAFITLQFIFLLVALLYNMPIEGYAYAVFLVCFVGMIFMGYDFYRFCQRKTALEDSKLREEFDINKLPKPRSELEKEYQDMLRIAEERYSTIISKRDNEKSDMIDYYTMWVHQIKNPIAALGLILQTEECESKDKMKMEIFKIEQYVDMVLQYLRLGSEQTDFLIKTLDLDTLIREVIRKYSTVFIKKKIKLEYEPLNQKIISDEKWMVFALEQIVSNSLKYTNKGKISIYMECAETHTLVIEDTGIGIQEEDLPRVCDRGFTGYNGRINRKSTGIGLYLCNSILTKLGNTMEIQSEVGHGTKVKIAFK